MPGAEDVEGSAEEAARIGFVQEEADEVLGLSQECGPE